MPSSSNPTMFVLVMALTWASSIFAAESAGTEAGRVVSFEVKSVAVSNTKIRTNPTRQAIAFLPPAYDDLSVRYPVVYYLPTSFKEFRSAFDRKDACGFLDREIASGTIE